MVASSETAWPSVMVKNGASALGGADGHGHFQFQAYQPTRAFAGEFPCNKASILFSQLTAANETAESVLSLLHLATCFLIYRMLIMQL